MIDDTDTTESGEDLAWYAIRTRQDFRAEEYLKPLCAEVLFPKETVRNADGRLRERALIPHVLFIRTSRLRALSMEKAGREHPEHSLPFWIYRYPREQTVREIPPQSIELLRMLTSSDPCGCEIYNRTEFKARERVRVTGGLYRGLEGYVQRVRKNRHVVVRIEGVCLVMLPYLHPDLLERID